MQLKAKGLNLLSLSRSQNKPFLRRFQSPINSLIKVVAMMTGELEFDTSFSETVVTLEGSVQLIFIGFFVTANIVIINVLISIAITALREAEEIRENLAAMARALAVLELEQALKWLRVSKNPDNRELYEVC